MRFARDALVLARHGLSLWRSGQLRFRLETFGVYYPALPYARPWWKPQVRPLMLLLRRAPAYACWVLEMERVRRAGPEGWWEHRRER